MHAQVQFLLEHAATATPFVSTDGQACVSLPLSAFSHQVCSVHSPRFRDWLIDAFFREHREPPTPYALRQTIRTLEARAICSGAELPVNRRVASRGNPHQPNAILLDLANAAGEIVEITSDGWHITTDPAAAFLLSRGNAELPHPNPLPDTSHEPLAALQRLLNIGTTDFQRTLVWLLTTLRPAGPHPILLLNGPPSSGKSSAARMLRALIDPSSAPLLSLPYSEPELLAVAQHNWILAFDHVGPVRHGPSNTLCRLATGATLRHREKGDEREPLVQELHRPILITATAEWNPNEDLAERSLTVQLHTLTPATRRTETELWQEFESHRGAILAALCDATVVAMRAQLAKSPAPNSQLSVTNHSDAACWTIDALPGRKQSILDALNSTPTTPVLESIAAFLEKTPQWTGTATDLIYEIGVTSVTAHGISHHLRRHNNLLESKNIRVTFTRVHNGARLITLDRATPVTNHRPRATRDASYNTHPLQ